MSGVWLTNPTLTPAHDWKCDEGAVATWIASGWQVREDQSDPEPEVIEIPTAEAPDPETADETEPETPATTERS